MLTLAREEASGIGEKAVYAFMRNWILQLLVLSSRPCGDLLFC